MASTDYDPKDPSTWGVETELPLSEGSTMVKDLLTEELPEPPSVVDRFMPRGSITMIHAEAGVGKTQLAMKLCASAITGNVLLDWEPSAALAQRILYLDGELPRWLLKKRADSVFDTSHNIELFSAVSWERSTGDTLRLELSHYQDMLQQHIAFTGADMVVIDNRSNFYRGEENENDAAHAFNDYLKKLRELGLVIILCHHSNKQGGFRGASAMVDVLDNVIQLTRDEENVIKYQFTKHRLGPPTSFKGMYEYSYNHFGKLALKLVD